MHTKFLLKNVNETVNLKDLDADDINQNLILKKQVGRMSTGYICFRTDIRCREHVMWTPDANMRWCEHVKIECCGHLM
jgi:hypothetical protein